MGMQTSVQFSTKASLTTSAPDVESCTTAKHSSFFFFFFFFSLSLWRGLYHFNGFCSRQMFSKSGPRVMCLFCKCWPMLAAASFARLAFLHVGHCLLYLMKYFTYMFTCLCIFVGLPKKEKKKKSILKMKILKTVPDFLGSSNFLILRSSSIRRTGRHRAKNTKVLYIIRTNRRRKMRRRRRGRGREGSRQTERGVGGGGYRGR